MKYNKMRLSLTELADFAKDLSKKLKPPHILLLQGSLGSGKTTFTRFLVNQWQGGDNADILLSPKKLSSSVDSSSVPASSLLPNRRIHQAKIERSLVESPTFAVQNVYQSSLGLIYHVDLYRIRDDDDLESTAFWDIFSEPEKVFAVIIEWSDKLNPLCLPQNQWNYTQLLFSYLENDVSRRSLFIKTGREIFD